MALHANGEPEEHRGLGRHLVEKVMHPRTPWKGTLTSTSKRGTREQYCEWPMLIVVMPCLHQTVGTPNTAMNSTQTVMRHTPGRGGADITTLLPTVARKTHTPTLTNNLILPMYVNNINHYYYHTPTMQSVQMP